MLSSPRWVITAIVLGRWLFRRLLEGRCFRVVHVVIVSSRHSFLPAIQMDAALVM